MAFSCYFDTVLNRKDGKKVWNLQKGNGAKWTVEEEWIGEFHSSPLVVYTPQDGRKTQRVSFHSEEMSKYSAELEIFELNNRENSKHILKHQDLSKSKIIIISFDEYHKTFYEYKAPLFQPTNGFGINQKGHFCPNVNPVQKFRCKINFLPFYVLIELSEPAQLKETKETVDIVETKTEKKLEKLAEDLQSLLKNDMFSDVILVSGNLKIKAHKCILSARSSFFSKMFSKPMNEVNVSDIQEPVLKEMLFYIYSGTIILKDFATVRSLYITSHAYLINELKEICSSWLKNVTLDTVLDVLTLAEAYDDEKMKKEAMQFVSKNYANLKLKKTWKSFLKEYPALSIEILAYVIDGPTAPRV